MRFKIIWVISTLSLLISVFNLVLVDGWANHSFSYFFVVFVPIIIVFLYSTFTIGLGRFLLFAAISSFIGFFAEAISVNHFSLFGGEYFYNPEKWNMIIFDVPILIGVYWSIFIFSAYSILNSILFLAHLEKPNKFNKNIFLLVGIILVGGLIVLGIDLLLDPIKVRDKEWIWIDNGPYYNIPTGNFVGWFLVSSLAMAIFRLFEYFFPKRELSSDKNVYIIPPVMHLVLFLGFGLSALKKGMPELVVIGTFSMAQISIICLLLFYRYRPRTNNF